MALDIITTPDGVDRKLGCLPPASFPTGISFADAFPNEMLTIDEIRAALVGKASMWGRRQKWAGPKYVRDQHSYGACNGWATALRLARLRELRGEPYVGLSGADAYSQMNGGQDNGSALADGMKIVEANGVSTEELVPWDHVFSNQISAAAKAVRSRYKGFRTLAVDSELELASALVVGRVSVVAVHVPNGQAFMQMDGDGICRSGNGVGNHSVGVDDIRMMPDGTLNFDMNNEWNTSYCDGGYVWLTWQRQLQETVRNHRFWVLYSTTDDEGDNSTPPPIGGTP